MITLKKFAALVTLFVAAVAIGGFETVHAEVQVLPRGPSAFSVDFTNCIESIGVTLVPTDRARVLVPSDFHLVGEGGPVTPLVVRTARCDISVEGHKTSNGSITQIGFVIVPPDFTGDINNYTLSYYTTDPQLASALIRVGVNAQHVENISYGYVQGAAGSPVPFLFNAPRPGDPTYSLSGTVTRSASPSGSFVANWWQQGSRGNVKMNTNVPLIFIGTASLTLATDPNNGLGQLIGGSSINFPIIEQFNTFAGADMEVGILLP